MHRKNGNNIASSLSPQAILASAHFFLQLLNTERGGEGISPKVQFCNEKFREGNLFFFRLVKMWLPSLSSPQNALWKIRHLKMWAKNGFPGLICHSNFIFTRRKLLWFETTFWFSILLFPLCLHPGKLARQSQRGNGKKILKKLEKVFIAVKSQIFFDSRYNRLDTNRTLCNALAMVGRSRSLVSRAVVVQTTLWLGVPSMLYFWCGFVVVVVFWSHMGLREKGFSASCCGRYHHWSA